MLKTGPFSPCNRFGNLVLSWRQFIFFLSHWHCCVRLTWAGIEPGGFSDFLKHIFFHFHHLVIATTTSFLFKWTYLSYSYLLCVWWYSEISLKVSVKDVIGSHQGFQHWLNGRPELPFHYIYCFEKFYTFLIELFNFSASQLFICSLHWKVVHICNWRQSKFSSFSASQL